MTFAIGDYVIADHALYDDFSGITFEIVGFKRNILGQPLVMVKDIKSESTTVFYLSELSWEDGTRP